MNHEETNKQSCKTDASSRIIHGCFDCPFNLSDEQIDSIIYNLDEYARDYDSCEYGLPTHGEHIENMRILVKQFLNGL